IRELRPHMLHLFAHGTADEQAFVQVSTVANVAAGEDGSILIGARDLRQEGDPDENIWVIALNACDSAAVSGDARNLATQLVRFGFPAVIGMREPVKTSEARLVSQHFYTAAFEALQELPIAGRREVEWSLFLRRVRLHLAGSAITAQSSARWLLPILYARTEPFTIIRGNAQLPDAERIRLQAELSELKKQRDTAMQFPLSDDVKLKMKADFDAKIGQIEAQLV
ncbi:MAG: CHAT domain-containing protein, partial [Burkholderiales bacterium]